MKTNKQLLAIAIKQIGNTGGKYRSYVGQGGSWCDMFVFWLYDANGCGSLLTWKGDQRYFCPASIEWCKKNLAQIPMYLAQPCDLIYYDWDKNGRPNHIGIVESKVSTDVIKTIEGNTDGGKVARKTRNAKYVQGVFRPHFDPGVVFKDKALAADGDFGYQSIGGTEKALKKLGYYTGPIDMILGKGFVRAIQKLCGATQDGAWGSGTSGKLQTYLKKKGYYTGKVDKAFGKQSVLALQKWANAIAYPAAKPAAKPETKPSAKPTLKSYRIEIDLTNQIATVFGIYSDGSKKGIMSEFVSTARKGKSTPTGNFKIQGASGGRKAKYRTAKMSGGSSYAEYLCRFHGGKCMHGVPWKKRNTKGYVYKNEFNKLGSPASAGCVRMPIKLARYIYTHCPVGTPVIVFKGKAGSYPMGKPKKYTATKNQDPTE